MPRIPGKPGSTGSGKISHDLRYAVLGSGSDANAYVFSLNGRSIMVDNGFSLKEALSRLRCCGFDPASLDGVFLTHTHGDHLRGIGPLCRRLKLPLFTAAGLRLPDSVGRIERRFELVPGREQPFSWLTCRLFRTSHDAEESVGFSFDFSGLRVTIITDTGEVSDEMASLAGMSRLLFLEANYDEQMLAAGPYPPFLQARISSRSGHLSNSQAAELLSWLNDESPPEMSYLCHLSANNNSPECVEDELLRSRAARMRWEIAPRGEVRQGILPQKVEIPSDCEDAL